MSNSGFFISRVVVTGEGKPRAEVEFSPGLNVVTGLSDTGKSWIYSAINYVFGAKDPPEDIAERQGYTAIWVELKMFDKESTYTLHRSYGVNKVQLYECAFNEIDDKTELTDLSTAHAQKPGNVSAFLLKLSGIPANVNLKTNSKGETSSLSFRVLWDFISGSEIDILKKESPVFDGRETNNTRQKSCFNYLLTGRAEEQKYKAPSVTAQVNNARLAGQVELCADMISSWTGIVADLKKKKERFGDLKDLPAQIAKLSEQVDFDGNRVSAELAKRSEILDQLEDSKNRKRTIAQMGSRFALLRNHYQTDLSRLDFISEGHYLISQLQATTCPACGQELDDNSHVHGNGGPDALQDQSIQEACKKEALKIQKHLTDLQGTFLNLDAESTEIQKTIDSLEKQLKRAEQVLQNDLRVEWNINKRKLEQLLSYQQINSELATDQRNLSSLQQTHAELSKKSKEDVSLTVRPEEQTSDVDELDAAYSDFASRVQRLLAIWKFSEDTVEFDKDSFDVKVGSKARRSFGKGKRAVLFTAFQLGLMNYCINNERAHPRFVVLDSPLTAHKGKLADPQEDDDEELIPEEVQQEFFDSLARMKKDRQIIVFDNKGPTSETQRKCNTIFFTGLRDQPRTGFFPV